MAKESFFKRLIFLVRVNELHCSVKPLNLCSMETIFLLGYIEIKDIMKNLISSFSILNIKKNLNKNLKETSLNNKGNLVHYRRDLDSLG